MIQWYPGHMTKTLRMLRENISLVDIVIELLDARIPYSSKNPDIDALAANKRRIIALNKADLADPAVTAEWVKHYNAIAINSAAGSGLNAVADAARELMREKLERQRSRGRIFTPIRAMIVGIPNVGKSTFINKYTGSAATKTADKPGVTRGRQWVRIKKDFELLDTPGILWPKFEDKDVGMKLACCSALNDDIVEKTGLAEGLIGLLLKLNPKALGTRYKIEFSDEPPYAILEKIASARGLLLKGGQLDLERAAIILLDEFRGGKLGRITLESPMERGING